MEKFGAAVYLPYVREEMGKGNANVMKIVGGNIH